jgi:hypothetical protein
MRPVEADTVPTTMVVELWIGMSNEQLLEQMRLMKQARERGEVANVVCVITGFGDDSRDLWDIAEVRGFCRRLIGQGFISYLDMGTMFPGCPEAVQGTMGAAEVLLFSTGRSKADMLVLLHETEEALRVANDKADSVLGPLRF